MSRASSRPSLAATKTHPSTLVVGLDIGTTFSGASWAYHEKGSQGEPTIHVIENWPHKSGVAKVPTQIAFDTETLTPSTEILWGYGIEDKKARGSWLKLLLLDDQDLPDHLKTSAYLREAKQFVIDTHAHSGVHLMTHYLRAFWGHVIDSIAQVIGSDVVDSSHLRLVITVPAIWPHYAKDRMSTAAKEAGITDHNKHTTLDFMTEPEAAAICNFYGDRRFMQQQLAPGDTFFICDAGGGTVDLISYQVGRCSESAITLDEVVPGKGELCGAAFLDEAFERLLITHFGYARNNAQVSERQNVMDDGWKRRIKPGFDGDKTLTALSVPVPSGCQYYASCSVRQRTPSGTHCSAYEFTKAEIASVFDPIVKKVTHLIMEQIEAVFRGLTKPPKYIIMSGGFGQSKYLLQNVKAMVAAMSKGSTILGMNSSSWSAVSRGAVLQGLAGYLRPSQTIQVRSRVSRASNCTLQYETLDEHVHDYRDMAWSDEEGNYVAVDQPVWFLKYGDMISEGKYNRFEFYSLHPMSQGVPTTHKATIFHCRDTTVPQRLGDTIREFCTVEWSDTFRTTTEIVENDLGQDHYAVCFDVEMVARGAMLEFAVRVDGKKAAAKHVKVQYTSPDSHPKTLKRPKGLDRGESQQKPQMSQIRQNGRPTPTVKSEVAPSIKRKRTDDNKSAKKKSRKRMEQRGNDSYVEEEEEDTDGSWGSWRR